MRRLHLDYRRPPRTGAPVLLLLLVTVLSVLVAEQYRDLTEVLSEREAQAMQLRRQLTHQTAPRVRPDERATAKEMKQAAVVSARLSLPWDGLLRGIERTAQRREQDVALLSIRPDARRGIVKITGEARDFAGMIAYARALAQDESVNDVYIESHQIRQQDPQRPVRFELAARWRVAPP